MTTTTFLYELHDQARERGLAGYRRMSRGELEAVLAGEPAAAPADGRTIVEESVDGPLAVLTLHGATRDNTLTLETLEELAAAAERLARDPGVRLVAITGAGDRIFSAGADLASLDGLDGATVARRGSAACERIARVPVPTIALLNGHAVGGAIDLALACDWRVASGDAKLRFIHNELGYSPPWGAARRIAAMVPAGRALRLFGLCQTLTADEARDAGVVDEVVSRARLVAHARTLAARVAHGQRHAVAVTKRLLRERPSPAQHEQAFAKLWDANAKLTSSSEEESGGADRG
jgi:enoyl-CoA hydratase